jgi:hypothetical protein
VHSRQSAAKIFAGAGGMDLIKAGQKTVLWSFIAIASIVCYFGTASAHFGGSENVSLPVPEQLIIPYKHFLNLLGVINADNIIGKTKFAYVGNPTGELPGSALFRIEDKSTCNDDMCLNIIAHITDGELRADAMFVAGSRINMWDSAKAFFGLKYPTFPLVFNGANGTVTLYETSQGWVVISGTK